MGRRESMARGMKTGVEYLTYPQGQAVISKSFNKGSASTSFFLPLLLWVDSDMLSITLGWCPEKPVMCWQRWPGSLGYSASWEGTGLAILEEEQHWKFKGWTLCSFLSLWHHCEVENSEVGHSDANWEERSPCWSICTKLCPCFYCRFLWVHTLRASRGSARHAGNPDWLPDPCLHLCQAWLLTVIGSEPVDTGHLSVSLLLFSLLCK